MQRFFSLWVREFKHLSVLALPLIVSQLVQACSGFVGTAMVARLGANAVAASGLVTVTWLTLSVACYGVLNSISVLVSHQFGAKNYKNIGVIFWQGVWAAILLTVPTILLVWFEPYLLIWTHQSPDVTWLATQYLHTIVWCMLPLALIIVMEQFLIGIGRTRLVLVISLIQIPAEIFANYCFIFGKFGLPAFGVAGLGYGFTTVFVLADIVTVAYLFLSSIGSTFYLRGLAYRLNKQYFQAVFRVGWPIGLMYGIEVGAFAVVTFFMGYLGVVTLAAHQIAMQYLEVSITAVFALSQAITVRVGHAVGACDLMQVKRTARIGLLMSFTLMLLAGVLYTVFANYLLAADLNPQLSLSSGPIQLAISFLSVIAVFQLFDSQRISLVGVLRGLKDTKIPTLVSFVSFWLVGLTMAVIFGFVLKGGGMGIWWGLVICVAVAALILFIRLHVVLKRVDLAKIANV